MTTNGNPRPILGFCSSHPKEPAVATEQVKGQRKQRFCRACWDNHRWTKLGHGRVDVMSMMGRGPKLTLKPITKALEPRAMSRKRPYK